MAAQRMPVRELFDGACLLVAGVLLLTPGFLTDAIGFALLIPPLRSMVGLWAWRAMQKRGSVHVHGAGFRQGGQAGPQAGGGPVIDGEYEDLSTDERGQDTRPNIARLPEAGPGRPTTDDDKAGDPDSPWRRNED